MHSINLLPENEREEKYKKGGIIITKFFSFVLIVFLISFFAYFFTQEKVITKNTELLNSKMVLISKNLDEEINKNKFLLSENKRNDVTFLLSKHYYPSKVVSFLQNKFIDGIYLNSLTVTTTKENIKVVFDGVVKNYSSIPTQLYILKSSPKVQDVKIKDILRTKSGYRINGSFGLEKNIIFYYQK